MFKALIIEYYFVLVTIYFNLVSYCLNRKYDFELFLIFLDAIIRSYETFPIPKIPQIRKVSSSSRRTQGIVGPCRLP